MSDFESGLLPSIGDQFPNVEVKGCHFHFCQSIFRRIEKLGLLREYKDVENQNFRRFVKMVFAIAFISPEDITDVFNGHVDINAPAELRNQRNFRAFVGYLRNTWMAENSKYPPRMWSVHGLQDRRTNNDIEGNSSENNV